MNSFTYISEWLANNTEWLTAAVAFFAFLESLAIAGIVIPGVAILFAIAALAGISGTPISQILIAAFFGAVAGDVLSFYLGRHFHDRLRTTWPFSRYPEALSKGEHFFQKYGAISVVIGRFVGPLRPVLPLTAGMLGMPALRFISVNIASAIAWAPLYILPGYFSGRASTIGLETIDLSLIAFIALIAIIASAICFRTLHLSEKQANTLGAQYFLLLASTISFTVTATSVYLGFFDRLDVWLFSIATNLRNDSLDLVLVALTLLGDEPLLTALFVITTLLLFSFRQYFSGLAFAGAGALTSLTTNCFKGWFAVERPDFINAELTSLAFPSGHTSGVVVFVGVLASIMLTYQTRFRALTVILSAVFIASIASSRILLGVHWLSDIIGGLCLGFAIVSGTNILRLRWEEKTIKEAASFPKTAYVYIGIAWVACSYIYLDLSFEAAQKAYQIAF